MHSPWDVDAYWMHKSSQLVHNLYIVHKITRQINIVFNLWKFQKRNLKSSSSNLVCTGITAILWAMIYIYHHLYFQKRTKSNAPTYLCFLTNLWIRKPSLINNYIRSFSFFIAMNCSHRGCHNYPLNRRKFRTRIKNIKCSLHCRFN